MTTMMLTEAQADGRACVSCGADREAMVPVGRLEETGVQLFACVGGCALLFQLTTKPAG